MLRTEARPAKASEAILFTLVGTIMLWLPFGVTLTSTPDSIVKRGADDPEDPGSITRNGYVAKLFDSSVSFITLYVSILAQRRYESTGRFAGAYVDHRQPNSDSVDWRSLGPMSISEVYTTSPLPFRIFMFALYPGPGGVSPVV